MSAEPRPTSRRRRRAPAPGPFLRQPMNWLLAFVPLAVTLDHLEGIPHAVTFGAAALSILPLASLLIGATEQISHRIGQAAGGLLNATFGNAPELIIMLVALRAGQAELVKASIVGCILGNLLFVLGLSFFLGGLRHHTQEYNPRGTRVQATMLMIATISLIIPSGFHNFVTPETAPIEQDLNSAVAVVLLGVYILSLVFMLKTHPEYYAAAEGEEGHEEARWSVGLALGVLVGTSVVLAFVSEILVGSVEGTAHSLGMSKAFIGVIFLALIGGAAESMAAVVMARRNRVDTTMAIAVGSSIQIAVFVAPVLVPASYAIAPHPLNLVVGNAGSAVILLAVLITGLVAGDGQSNWFKGVQLLCAYLLVALFCYFLPDSRAAFGAR